MHIHGGQESCVSFCHRDTIGSKIQRRPKKMHERTFWRAEVRNKETKKQRKQNPKIPHFMGIHVSTEFAPNCSTTHVV